MSGDFLKVEGTVLDFSHGVFRCEVDFGGQKRVVSAHRSAMLQGVRLAIVAGDHVALEISPYDLTKARIRRRLDASG